MRCPRCHLETGDPTPAFCPQCGAPLRLADEGPPRRLDAPIAMDRRGDARRTPLPVDCGAPAAALVLGGGGPPAAGGSHWALGAVLAVARAEPLGVLPEAADDAGPPEALADGALETMGDLDVEVDALEIRLRRPASWRRVAAGAVDALPFAAAGLALARSLLREAAAGLPAPPTGLDGLLDVVSRDRVIVLSVVATVTLALVVYATLAHALAGATLGKWVLGLRLVGPDGRRPSLARSAWRAALAVVSGALLGLGFHLALFTRSGRALHDLAARTWVVEAP
jgi:resuscitation-promoting factor RpfA